MVEAGFEGCALPFRDSDGRTVGGTVDEASVDGETLWSRHEPGVCDESRLSWLLDMLSSSS
jgi:hypothetical protein